jgi:pyruvate dehydrogenase E2 component (dihydrolipoamide acetyltransferase)
LKEFKIPKVGMGITEVEITKWEVRDGDKVKKGDPIVEISTEKASTVLESDIDGTIDEVFFEEEEMVAVGEVICNILDDQ